MKHTPVRRFSTPAVALAICFASARTILADVTLPAIFSDHMVLQQGAAAPVWGWADPREEITVSLGGQSKSVRADADGKWMLKLDPLRPGENLTMTVKGKNIIVVEDVLAGEVWLCSGQSNMGMTVSGARDFEQEKAAADFPKLRMFKESSGPSPTPQEQGKGAWFVCRSDTVGGFSATAYFFGREIHQKLGGPVGLINSSVGGTPIEAWTSWDAQKPKNELTPIFQRWEKAQAAWDPVKSKTQYETNRARWKAAVAKAKAEGTTAPRAPRQPIEPRLDGHHPANLFNGKIVPLIPYAIAGAIWYQGESNAGLGELYQLQLETMVKDWRGRWGSEFPFAWVQLPNFHQAQTEPVEDTGWVRVREGMLKALRLPKTGMAITLDLGEANDIHPKNKQDVGKRLAMWALASVYGRNDVAASGPLPARHEIRGNEVIVSFRMTDGGLAAKGGELKGFAVAGADRRWVRATATISGNQVVVASPDVPTPVALRYAWADNPDFSLYNGAGLPASPFRTDDWARSGANAP